MNILLVDDDQGAIDALLPFLESLPDIAVRSASSGEEALEQATAWGHVDLLLTDIAMEPMNGFTLRNKLENRLPNVKTIFMSGYAMDDYAEFTSGCPVLVKPFESNDLVDLIQQSMPPKTVAPTPAPAPVEIPASPAAAHAVAPEHAAAQHHTGVALAGNTLGNYKIISLLSEGPQGTVYAATQTSMNRPVALKVLALELQQDVATREQFIADAQAKAKVQHPVILSVYEAGESGPYCYYTLEYVDGMNLADYAKQGLTVDDGLALQLIRAAGEALLYLDQKKISHNPLEPRNLYVDANKHPRLANVATQHEFHPETQKEIVSLSQIIKQVLPAGRAADPALQALMHRMSVTGNGGFLNWTALLQAVKALAPKVIPVGASKITAQDKAAIHAVEEAQQRKKLALLAKIGGAVALVALLFAGYWFFFHTSERIDEVMVKIPAGDFIFQDGQKVTLPDFWIDQYEVTIGQYAKFLKYLDSHPDAAAQYEHTDQPRGKSHKPKNWDTYYNAARSTMAKNRNVDSVAIDLDYPVSGVDWWDAYAYAKWMGRRLPTQQEWEKAGRGTDGRLYPWGNDFDPKKCNSAIDFNADPHISGSIDGYNRWSPVDAMKGDCSPYNVYGMAGNVSEWTSSTDLSGKFRVARGGSCHSVDDTSQPDVRITKSFSLYPNDSSDYVGFRTVASEPPDKK